MTQLGLRIRAQDFTHTLEFGQRRRRLLTISTILTATLAAAALVGVVSMRRVRGVWRAAAFDEEAYLMARHFRADVYLQQRVAWEEPIKVHLAMPDATKGE